MYFDSLQALWEMSGHGPYVWSAVFISASVVVALVLHPVFKRRRILAAIVQRKRFEEQQ